MIVVAAVVALVCGAYPGAAGGPAPLAVVLGAPFPSGTAPASPVSEAAPGYESGGRTVPALNDSRPNIVLLLIDDFPAMDDRVFERLPNIKATFVDQGLSFDNFWADFSLCCPARATLLTGQRSDHTGVQRNSGRLFDPTETIATELDSVGYYTGIIGKYFNGTSQIPDKTPPGWDYVAVKDDGPYFDYPVWVNGVRQWHGHLPSDYSVDVMANESMSFFTSAPAAQPLFAYLTPNATHGGWDENHVKNGKMPVAAPRFRGDPRCAAIPKWKPASYNEADVSDKPPYIRNLPLLESLDGWDVTPACEALLAVDEWLGRVRAALNTQGRLANTLFILTSDNGMGWGAHRYSSKVAPYTAHMPLHVSWPAAINGPRSEVNGLLSNTDVAPTLCEIAGCAMGPFPNGHGVDGQSFAGLIDDAKYSSVPIRDSIFIQGQAGTAVPAFRAIMTGANHARGQWLLIRYIDSGFKELYDMSGGPCATWQVGDPGDSCMLTNVARKRQGVRQALLQELANEW
ncbi:MAG: sulfatase-like hydrolase/transferase [Chloroflexota bacterium]